MRIVQQANLLIVRYHHVCAIARLLVTLAITRYFTSPTTLAYYALYAISLRLFLSPSISPFLEQLVLTLGYNPSAQRT